MYRALLAFATGVYIGTYYDCKPIVNQITKLIKEHIPEKPK
jgi:hypothetical protein